MSLSAARKYFVDQFKTSGYQEHNDPFDIDNIPSTILHKSFQIATGSFVARGPANQRTFLMDCPVVVKIFLKGYLTPSLAIDNGMDAAEALVLELMRAENRIGHPVKNVILNRITPEAFAVTNNSIAVITMEFTTTIILGTN
jgi:hypothetical protein